MQLILRRENRFNLAQLFYPPIGNGKGIDQPNYCTLLGEIVICSQQHPPTRHYPSHITPTNHSAPPVHTRTTHRTPSELRHHTTQLTHSHADKCCSTHYMYPTTQALKHSTCCWRIIHSPLKWQTLPLNVFFFPITRKTHTQTCTHVCA